jgi:trigger factor
MQISVENTSGLERRLTVQVPGREIQDKIDNKLRELTKQVRIKGFRPGRVPLSVVKQRYGKQVRQDIVNEAVQEGLQQAIREESMRPASMPRLEAEPENNDNGDLEFKALIEVYPTIEPLDVSSIEVDRPQAEVSDEDVENMINTLREQRKTWEAVERKAQAGDRVVIEYSAKTKDTRVPDEGRQKLAIIMGESAFDDLEKEIAGIEPGSERKFKLKFPEGFREEALREKKASVELAVISVSEGKLPEVNEEFIKSFGIAGGDLDAFQAEVRGNLERELSQASKAFLKNQLTQALLGIAPGLEVPKAVVREEAAGMVTQMAQGQQLPPEQLEPLLAQFIEPAEKRVRAGLLMGELAHQNNLHVDAGKVREAIETVASTYEEPAEVVQLYYSNQRLLQQVESSVLEEQVVDWVLENAKVTDKEMKFQEVIAAATAPQA